LPLEQLARIQRHSAAAWRGGEWTRSWLMSEVDSAAAAAGGGDDDWEECESDSELCN